MPINTSPLSFNLENFEGPIDLLLHLIENKELDIYQVMIEEILGQYKKHLKTLLEYDLDLSAEFLAIVSTLMLLKSKMLLPQSNEEIAIDESTLRVDILEHLIHYYKFKDMALKLKEKQDLQKSCYFRGSLEPLAAKTELKKPSQEFILSDLFLKVLEKKKLKEKGLIYEEEYRISDKIKEWKSMLKTNPSISFYSVFDIQKPKGELITLFLALLEILKNGVALICERQNTIYIQPQNDYE